MKINYSVFFYFLIGGVFGQSRTMNTKPLTCDTPSQASKLVEDFFNTIFTEFQSTPPLCVCVQMCPEQTMYCYPNACFKKEDVTKIEESKPDVPKPTTRRIEAVKSNYFGDELANDFAEKTYVAEGQVIHPGTPKPDYSSRSQSSGVQHLDPLELGSMDLFDFKTPAKSDRHSLPPVKNSRFFVSMLSDKNVNAPSKYFKRELYANSPTDVDREQNDDAEENITKPESDAHSHSLDSLFRNLLEDEFIPENSIADITIETDIKDSDLVKRFDINTNNEPTKLNVTTDVMSINMTNENIDKNIYKENSDNNNKNENLTDVYNTIIGMLSKSIEAQNNTSLEILRHPVEYDIDREMDMVKTFINNMWKENVSRVIERVPDSIVFEEASPKKQNTTLRKNLNP